METSIFIFWPFACDSPHCKKIAAVKAKRLFPVVTFIPEYLNKNEKSTYSVITGNRFGLSELELNLSLCYVTKIYETKSQKRVELHTQQ